MTFAEAMKKAAEDNTGFQLNMEEQEAEELGISFFTYRQWKKGFTETYEVVTERLN